MLHAAGAGCVRLTAKILPLKPRKKAASAGVISYMQVPICAKRRINPPLPHEDGSFSSCRFSSFFSYLLSIGALGSSHMRHDE